jgi:hypothetical protein
MWQWLYFAFGFLAVSQVTTMWNFHILRQETDLAGFKRITRFGGYSIIFITGIPFYAAAGWADQHGYLSPLMETLVAWAPAPSALIACHIFLRDWNHAISDSHSADPG